MRERARPGEGRVLAALQRTAGEFRSCLTAEVLTEPQHRATLGAPQRCWHAYERRPIKLYRLNHIPAACCTQLGRLQGDPLKHEAFSAAEQYQAGRRFEPKEARQALELAAFFEPRLLALLAKLSSEQPPETSFRRIEQLFPLSAVLTTARQP